MPRTTNGKAPTTARRLTAVAAKRSAQGPKSGSTIITGMPQRVIAKRFRLRLGLLSLAKLLSALDPLGTMKTIRVVLKYMVRTTNIALPETVCDIN